MSEKYKFLNPDGLYFTTSTIVDWIDLFTRRELCDVIIDSLIYNQKNKGLVIHGWNLMPSHLHLIVSRRGIISLEEIFRDWKKFTSKQLIRTIKEINESRAEWLLDHFQRAANPLKRIDQYKVWQDGNHPVELDGNKMMDERLNYMHHNPVEAGFVLEPEHWQYSSAGDYAGVKGLIEIEPMD